MLSAPGSFRCRAARVSATGFAVLSLALALACGDSSPGGDRAGMAPVFDDAAEFTGLSDEPLEGASEEFWSVWGDGRAELSSYRIVTPRYGEERTGELVLIYVTEPHDRRTWIKDDAVADPHRVEVLKLNVNLEFLTGIYPYSVMTSVFAPVARWEEERFSPVKITLSAQEWCGHVYHGVWPGPESFRNLRLSYFAEEGERRGTVPTPENTLYEDALLIQLRELDGPFAEGGDWEGWIVPSLWRQRAGHEPARPVEATIERREAVRDGVPVERFILRYAGRSRTFDVERRPPRRILAWSTGEGERAELLATERLAYWRLNAPGGERHREDLRLHPEGPQPPPAAGPERP